MTVCVFSKSAGSYQFGVFDVETPRFAFEALIKNLPTSIECLGIKRRFNCQGQKIAFGSFVINFFVCIVPSKQVQPVLVLNYQFFWQIN